MHEGNVSYTVFSDSIAAISKAQTDRASPRQAFARATIEVGERLTARRCSVILRWTPPHRGVEGNEVVNDCAKVAAECAWDAVDRQYL